MRSTETWAEDEFGKVDLGDRRRVRRLVHLAAEVADRPSGTITRACATSASREGAFRFLENPSVRPDAISAAVHDATARRCQREKIVFVPIDASSLTLTDLTHRKGLGSVGTWSQGARGVHAMTAFAVAENGSSIGVCAQHLWVRNKRSVHGESHHRRPGAESEGDLWLKVLSDARATLAAVAPKCKPWFQMDRGADCWQVLALAHEERLLVTVRARYDRSIDAETRRLWDLLKSAPISARKKIAVRPRAPVMMRRRVPGRRIKWLSDAREARIASIEVRAAKTPLVLTTHERKQITVPFNAVLVREVGNQKDAVEWMLLTNHPVDTQAQILEIVRGYTLRWRIEEFHRTWKNGHCRVEDSQLRSRAAVFKWAIILGAVATRAMRLTHLARTTPDVPASSELTPVELEALWALRLPKGVPRDTVPTLSKAVRWLADIGGYMGPWNGLPGATTIGRGLQSVLIAARAFEARDKKR